MNKNESRFLSRRAFVGRLASATGAGLVSAYSPWAAAESPPETTRIRIVFDERVPALCYGPQYVAMEFLRLEGFDEVSFVPMGDGYSDANTLIEGDADITVAWAGDMLLQAEGSHAIRVLGGLHVGCTEIFAGDRVKGFDDLAGKRVANYAKGSPEEIWFSMMVAYIGIDPADIEWVLLDYGAWADALKTGEVDAVMLWPPDSLAFRKQNLGHVIMNTTTDRPWRDYFCCMVAGNRSFVARNPVATKRALRAMLKAADLCTLDPDAAGRAVAKAGLPFDPELAAEVFREIPYVQWREFDPLDTLRFFALRLHEIDRLRGNPEVLVTEIADWRFLEELKHELKA